MKKLLFFVLCVIFLFSAFGCGNKVDAYNQTLYEFNLTALASGIIAEDTGNMVKSIWYDTIYKEKNADTEAYVFSQDGIPYDDFNISLGLYFSTDEYKIAVSSMEESLVKIDEQFRELKDPPKDCVDGYDIAKEVYESCESLLNITKSPTGSLQSFSDSFSEADTKLVYAYEKLNRYFDSIDFEPSFNESPSQS